MDRRTSNSFFMLGCIVLLAIIVCIGYGYINNIVQLCYCDFETPIKAEVIRGIGVLFAPVGIIAGWCDIEDGKPCLNPPTPK